MSVFEGLADRITQAFPAGERVRDDLHKNGQVVLKAALARMDLVTREDFDVQTQLLARTRAKLEELERQVEALESAPNQTD